MATKTAGSKPAGKAGKAPAAPGSKNAGTATATKPKAEKAPAAAKAPKAEKAAKPAATKVERLRQNGQTRPTAGSTTGKVWDIADRISKKENRPATRAEVMKEYCEKGGGKPATCATQYGRWRTFWGLPRTVKAATPAATPAEPVNVPAEIAPQGEDVVEGGDEGDSEG